MNHPLTSGYKKKKKSIEVSGLVRMSGAFSRKQPDTIDDDVGISRFDEAIQPIRVLEHVQNHAVLIQWGPVDVGNHVVPLLLEPPVHHMTRHSAGAQY